MAEGLSDICGNCGAQLESGVRKCAACRAVKISKMAPPGSVLFGTLLLFWLGGLLLLTDHLLKGNWHFHLNDLPLVSIALLLPIFLVIVRLKAKRVVVWRRPPFIYKNGLTIHGSGLAGISAGLCLGRTVFLTVLGILFVLLFVPPALRVWSNLPGRIQFRLIIISVILMGGIFWYMRVHYLHEQYGI